MDTPALEALLAKLFPNAKDLRRFLRNEVGEALVNRLPGPDTPRAEQLHQAAIQLASLNLADAAFAAKLREEFPACIHAINGVFPPILGVKKIRLAVVITGAMDVDPSPVVARLGALGNILVGPPKVLRLGRDALDADALVLLLGPGHGGALDALTALVDDNRCVGVAVPYDYDAIEPDPGVRPLRQRLHKATTDVPAQVQGLGAAWDEANFPATPGGIPTLHAWEQRYLEDKAPVWRCGEPGGLRVLLEGRAERAAWFVHLRAERPWVLRAGKVERVMQVDAPNDSTGEAEDGSKKTLPSPLLDQVLGRPELPRVAVVGGAGAGKSVLLAHIAWTLCRLHLHLQDAARSDDEPAQLLDIDALTATGPILPVPVVATAATLVAKLRSPGGRADRPIRAGLERLLSEEIFPGEDLTELRGGLDSGRYWFLIDSLDEVPLQADRDALVKALGALNTVRLTLTTRPMAHTDVELPGGFERVDIAPLEEDRIARVVGALLRVSGREAKEQPRAVAAIEATRRDFPTDAEGRSPAENPLLLAIMTLLWLKHGNLPDDRAMLYQWMIQLLCETRVRAADDDEKARHIVYFREDLRLLAFTSQERFGTAMPIAAACDALVKEKRASDAKAAEARLEQIVNRTGLFRFETIEGQRVIRPWHRSFQEYLAATKIAADYANKAPECSAWLLANRGRGDPRLRDGSWTQTLRFLVGAFGEISDAMSAQIVTDWVDRAARQPEHEARLLALAGGGVAEYQKRLFGQRPALREDVRSAIHQSFAARGADWPWEDRLDALDALGRLGDPRLPDPTVAEGLTVEKGWVNIAGGDYAVGGDPAAPNALNAATVRLSPFFIRVWPVTVAEFEGFVAAGGVDNPLFWGDGRFADQGLPPDWLDQLRHPNRPVTWVDWFASRAFCRWASTAWRIPAGAVIDLPTSREWEAAARRGTGRIYPWDSDPKRPLEPGEGDAARAAYDWGGVPFSRRGATPVGAFRRGYTPEAGAAIWDLAGNVWEWCATLGGEPEIDIPWDLSDNIRRQDDKKRRPDDGRLRVVRGGSWINPAWGLRAARRLRYRPVGRGDGLGFRVVLRPPEPR